MTFQPAKGRDFARPDNILVGTRLLVLGESHYSRDPKLIGTSEPKFTTQVVQDFPIAGKRQPFFDRLARAALWREGDRISRDEIKTFWEAVLFYNYVPVVVDGNDTRSGGQAKRPSARQFEAGAEPFRKVQQEYRPSAVLVCGLELWDSVASDLDGFEDIGLPAKDVILYDDGRSMYARIHHPSYVKFKPDYWKPRIDFLLQQACQSRVPGRKMLWKDWPLRQFT